MATAGAQFNIPAADLTGATGIEGEVSTAEGLQLVDYDQLVDRNEELILLTASHRLHAYVNSTETADGTLLAVAEVSAAPSMTGVTQTIGNTGAPDFEDPISASASLDDSIDLIGRPMSAVATGPFSDGATGVGGGGSASDDEVEVQMAPAEYGRFHPRDELFANIRIRTWNIDDAAVHAIIALQHVYGVLPE